MDYVKKEEVLEVVKRNGPIIPIDIRKHLGKGDTITIGACLSQLLQYKQVKLTNVKRGGSPFYYVSGQENKLQELSQFLNEKDRRTYEALKERKIIRDKDQEPLTRVSLRMIKDYSKQMNVNTKEGEEIFWKWYLLTDEEAIKIIRELYASKPSVKTETPPEKPAPEAKPEKKVEEAVKETLQEPAAKEEKQETIIHESSLFKENKDAFTQKLKAFFEERKIIITEEKTIRKGSEYDFVIEISTPVGKAEYYCKAKKKKKCGDGDLSTAYLKGQNKRLPVLFITNGEIAKKAKEKLKTDYKGMITQEI